MTTGQIMQRILLLSGILAIAVAVIGGVVGYVVAGIPGVISALVGTALAIVFCALTAVSIVVALRASKHQLLSPAFFAVVFAGWLVKFALFIALIFVLREQPWLHAGVTFGAIVTAVIGSLIIDCIVIAMAKQPEVDDVADDETLGHPAKR